MAEGSLHESIKDWYARPQDEVEARVDGYIIDILRDDVLIEIQTASFSSIRDKLARLVRNHKVLLVHPIPVQKWIVRLGSDGDEVSRRKSPRKGRIEDLFFQLVYMPTLLNDPNLSIEVLLVHSEELLIDDGKGSWRRKGWSVHDRRLLEVVERVVFERPTDVLRLLPPDLPDEFTNQDLIDGLCVSRPVAQKMTFTLTRMGVVVKEGKRGRANLFRVSGTGNVVVIG